MSLCVAGRYCRCSVVVVDDGLTNESSAFFLRQVPAIVKVKMKMSPE
jgi:hypothetical protein